MNKRQALVNVAVGGPYPAHQDRLLASLDAVGERTPRVIWRDQWPTLPHAKVPYGFKLDALLWTHLQGYERALWLDSQVVARKTLDLVWQWLDRTPVLLLEDGWVIGQWTSDAALEMFGLDRDTAMSLPLCYAKVVGIDFETELGRTFFERWLALRAAGAFQGPWGPDPLASCDPRFQGHRHDQSCASWLAWDLAIPMAPIVDFLGPLGVFDLGESR